MFRQVLTLLLALTLLVLPAWGEESSILRAGKVWLRPTLLVNLSWDDVDAVCGSGAIGGRCSGPLGTADVTGYHWASYSDLIGFLQSYGAPAGPFMFSYQEPGSEWAPQILNDLRPTSSDSDSETVSVWSREERGEVAEMTDLFDPLGVDYWDVYTTASAASGGVGVLLWRDANPPRPSLGGVTVTPTGTGVYNVFGSVRDTLGDAACALALASGRCMFTCGPGSLRCEGGSDEMDSGDFALYKVPTEADGSILLQVFMAGHVSLTERLEPSNFGTTPLPAPSAEPMTFSVFYGDEFSDVSGCFTVSADATQLVSTQSECTGGAALEFDADIRFRPSGNEPGCNGSVNISLSKAIPIVNQGFTVTTEDGGRVTGYFRDFEFWADGSIQDASGCRANWTAFREDFQP